MYGEEAVVAVIGEINSLALPNFEGIVFKYDDKPKNYKGEYIAVNHLPFVYSDVLGDGIVNVNVHVPSLANNKADTGRLFELWRVIASDFEKNEDEGRSYGQYLQGAYFSFYSHSRPTLDEDGTYYVNVQLQVTYNNLK